MLTITVQTGDEAFGDNPNEETARILRRVASRIERGSNSGPIMDANGSCVGAYALTREPGEQRSNA